MTDRKVWVKTTYASDIPLREGRAVQIGPREIAIFNVGDRFLAIENRCPHKNGPLSEGIVSGSVVVCPLHAWKFSLQTGKGASAASELSCIRTFPTRVEQGVVFVELGLDSPNGDDARVEDVLVFCTEQEGVAQSTDSAISAN